MYNFLQIFFVAMILCLGLFMAIFPKAATKKDMREDEAAVAKNRKSGIILTVAGIVALIIVIFVF